MLVVDLDEQRQNAKLNLETQDWECIAEEEGDSTGEREKEREREEELETDMNEPLMLPPVSKLSTLQTPDSRPGSPILKPLSVSDHILESLLNSPHRGKKDEIVYRRKMLLEMGMSCCVM
jgi:hypothetical protein